MILRSRATLLRWADDFHPPRVVLDNDIRWVLLAAFADPYPNDARPDSPERAAKLIQQFDLVNQVAYRLTKQQLEQAITPQYQQHISNIARSRIMHSLAVVQARELACRTAEETGVDIVLLKQAALEVMGLVTPAQRFGADVDILVRASDIGRLSDALCQRGCQERKRRSPKYHPMVLRTPADVSIEMHTVIPYVRMAPRDDPVDLRCLIQQGLVATGQQPQQPHVFLPNIQLLAAHLVAHNLVQHRFTPRTHPPLRTLRDAYILRLDENPEHAKAAYALIAADILNSEFSALCACIGSLKRGVVDAHEESRKLLSHLIAASIDENYQARLQVQREWQVIREYGIRHWALSRVQRVFAPTEEELTDVVNDGAAADQRAARRMLPSMFARQIIKSVTALFRVGTD